MRDNRGLDAPRTELRSDSPWTHRVSTVESSEEWWGHMPPPDDEGVDLSDSMAVCIPASHQHLDVLRFAVGRAASATGFTFDGIEDLALAISESAALLLEYTPRELCLEIQGVRADSDQLTIGLTMVPPRYLWPPASLTDELRWKILGVVTETHEIITGERTGISIRQHVR